MDILSMLNSMDKSTLENALKQAQSFLSTPEGQDAAKKLSEGKMPDGTTIPDDLKDAAKVIGKSESAQNMLGEYLKRRTDLKI